jgi:Uma2 family endonuclease
MASFVETDVDTAVVDTASPAFQEAAFPPMPVCRLSVDTYEEMIRAGIITREWRIELLDGWMVPKMTQNQPHIIATELVRNVVQENLPPGWCILSEKPFRLRRSMPEPDAMVVRGPLRQYRDRRIRAEDVGLIVEVADASLWRDKELKKTLYAQASIPVYWLVNLIDNRIEVYSEPAGSDEKADYRQRRDYTSADEIPLVLDGRQIAAIPARDLLP